MPELANPVNELPNRVASEARAGRWPTLRIRGDVILRAPLDAEHPDVTSGRGVLLQSVESWGQLCAIE
jgi:hypothetical protein